MGIFTIIALTITSMVGTGMFFGTAIGAGYAGNAVIISWIILLLISIYVAACFGELIALFPKAGGVYEFSKHAYGRFFSFIIGWVTWMMANISTTVLIVAALEYLLPPGFNMAIKIIIAIGIILLLNLVAYLGVDTSAAVLIFFATVSIAVLLAIIIPGSFHFNPGNFTPFFSFPPIAILVALFFMLEGLMGWEQASFLAEETVNPEKVIPKSLIISTIVAGLLALGVAVVSLGIIPWQSLAVSSAYISELSSLILGGVWTKVIAIGIVLTLIGSAAGGVISMPRLLLAMARDKLFIAQLAAIHPKRKTPHKAIFFQLIVSILIIIIGFGQYTVLLSMFVPLALIMYIAVIMAVPILRVKLRHAHRAFKTPFGIIGPVLVSLLYIGVVGAWLFQVPGAFSLFRLILSFVFFGLPIYLLLIFFYNPDAIVRFTNYFSRLNLWMENFLLPKKLQKEILGLFRDLKDKSVLEYGSGVGTLTLHLAEAVGPGGKVYATDLSHRNIHLLSKRLEKKKLGNVIPVHDEHQVNRVPPSVGEVDFVFSVGMMGYMQDVKKILAEMNRRLPESGRVLFIEYVNFFQFLPDAEWISDLPRLRRIFREAGFSVKIEKKYGLLWNYLLVYGIKSERDVPVI
ncbi:amino acid permease [Candidatus Woesearchaeota archaeon]|nr:amino acid permease [Candidatus Woesearchaeota archaeon]